MKYEAVLKVKIFYHKVHKVFSQRTQGVDNKCNSLCVLCVFLVSLGVIGTFRTASFCVYGKMACYFLMKVTACFP